MVTMLTYSARKNEAYLRLEYSVPKPATSSDSASGRSNGARLVSPTIAMTKMTKLGARTRKYQPGRVISKPPRLKGMPSAWASTMAPVDISCDWKNTVSTARPRAIS